MKIVSSMLLWMLALVASANDGVFYVNGNQIVPINETDIAVTKEVLTITLDNSEFARVDVQYEFTNRGNSDKVVDMGFEAAAPYDPGSEAGINRGYKHPHIFDFTVVMNGSTLSYTNRVVEQTDHYSDNPEHPTNFKQIDLNVWHYDTEFLDGVLIKDNNREETMNFSYAYIFKATFKPGKNLVHHTYRYRMSNGVGRVFEVPYWLLPAMRWANHQIDDFTLRIVADKTALQFCLEKGNWVGGQWKVTSGVGKVHELTPEWGGDNVYEFSLRNGTYEWHGVNFKPKSDFSIISADNYLFNFEKTYKLGRFYNRNHGPSYQPYYAYDENMKEKVTKVDGIEVSRIKRNLPYASRGYVFKDQKLAAYFKSLWWYMPDPNWVQSQADFLPEELK